MRYISLYDGNDLHPAMLDFSERAWVEFVFDGASYWVVDRMSSLQYGDAVAIMLTGSYWNKSGRVLNTHIF